MNTALKILTPCPIGSLSLTNRLVMAPMTRNRADPAGNPQPLMATYYAQRASAGLIVSEATQVCPEGRGYPCTPGIYTPEHVNGWRQITNAVHKAGGLIFLQLWHCGRISHSSYQPNGGPPPAPSAIEPRKGEVMTYQGPKPFETPRALETSEIPSIVAHYRNGAKRAIEAGFDGVEVHAANGYLIDQFLRNGSNTRTDKYGGTVENRARLLLEVVDAVIGEVGSDRVSVRLSPNGTFNDMSDSDPVGTFSYAISELSKRKIAFLHFIEKMMGDPVVHVTLAQARSWFNGPLAVNGGFTKERAEQVVGKGLADLVAIGVPFIANPDLVERFKRGAPLNEPDMGTFYGGSEKGYTDYPTL
jgi:N-ethylmaleimide reductase